MHIHMLASLLSTRWGRAVAGARAHRALGRLLVRMEARRSRERSRQTERDARIIDE